MKKSRFSEEQIAFALRQAETGAAVAEITRKMGVTEATFYRWKKKFGGLGVTYALDLVFRCFSRVLPNTTYSGNGQSP